MNNTALRLTEIAVHELGHAIISSMFGVRKPLSVTVTPPSRRYSASGYVKYNTKGPSIQLATSSVNLISLAGTVAPWAYFVAGKAEVNWALTITKSKLKYCSKITGHDWWRLNNHSSKTFINKHAKIMYRFMCTPSYNKIVDMFMPELTTKHCLSDKSIAKLHAMSLKLRSPHPSWDVAQIRQFHLGQYAANSND